MTIPQQLVVPISIATWTGKAIVDTGSRLRTATGVHYRDKLQMRWMSLSAVIKEVPGCLCYCCAASFITIIVVGFYDCRISGKCDCCRQTGETQHEGPTAVNTGQQESDSSATAGQGQQEPGSSATAGQGQQEPGSSATAGQGQQEPDSSPTVGQKVQEAGSSATAGQGQQEPDSSPTVGQKVQEAGSSATKGQECQMLQSKAEQGKNNEIYEMKYF
ncbi:kinesin-4-like isoform X1 [Labeo rohita]|uniref:Kinesin-4-like isoform X1 n=1 Tax=Labeo rohita TaxID=84645 RepID=A0A498LC76_LABRO|nr:kinesin-4-like isoform X1 [Labeo rohita]